MAFDFRPARDIHDRHGLFIALVGGPGAGKTYSSLRLARGIAGPHGRIAVADTEGGRTLHLKNEFNFDVTMMDPPHRPGRYAELARDAEAAKYDVLVIDSFSAEWAGLGGVLGWADEEAQRMARGDESKLERVKGASWIKPKQAHKSMVYSLLERRIPIIFSIRGEETFKPPAEKFFKAVCNQSFLFEVTVSFRLSAERKGYIDLSDHKSWKMEGAHAEMFKHGEQLCERHGEQLAAWARGGGTVAKAPEPPAERPLPTEPPVGGPYPPGTRIVTHSDGQTVHVDPTDKGLPLPGVGPAWRLIKADGKVEMFPHRDAFAARLKQGLTAMGDAARIDAFRKRNADVFLDIAAKDSEAGHAIQNMINERISEVSL
jgi:hypothetical protein